jgi:type IV pilus assembly protein PilM
MTTPFLKKSRPWPRVIGVDISNQSIKYVLIRRRGAQISVERFGRFSLNEGAADSPEVLVPVLNKIFDQNKDKKAVKTVIGLEGSRIVVKREKFPSLSVKEIKQSLAFEIQRELGPESTEATLVADIKPVESGSPDNYLVMGALEEDIDERILPFSSAGVVPAKIIPYVVAIANLAKLLPDKSGLIGILDIGAQKSTLTFLQNNEMDFYREIVVGGVDFTRAITGTIFHEGRAIQFSTEEANDFKMKYGYPLGFSEGMTFRGAPLSEVGAMMRPIVERLIGEIQRSIGFYEDKTGGKKLEKLYLIGGGSKLKHLSEVIAQKTGISVLPYPISPSLRVEGSDKKQKLFKTKFLEQAVSLALAMEDNPTGNLLPEPYKKIHKTAFITRGIHYGVAAVVFMILLFSISAKTREQDKRRKAFELEKGVFQAENIGQLFAALTIQQDAIREQIRLLDEKMRMDQDIIQILKMVSNILPDKLTLTDYHYALLSGIDQGGGKQARKGEPNQDANQMGLRIGGMSKTPWPDVGVSVTQFILDLEKSGFFKEVSLSSEEYDVDENLYVFSILAKLKGSAIVANQ